MVKIYKDDKRKQKSKRLHTSSLNRASNSGGINLSGIYKGSSRK
jgi:hypothetical protein